MNFLDALIIFSSPGGMAVIDMQNESTCIREAKKIEAVTAPYYYRYNVECIQKFM